MSRKQPIIYTSTRKLRLKENYSALFKNTRIVVTNGNNEINNVEPVALLTPLIIDDVEQHAAWAKFQKVNYRELVHNFRRVTEPLKDAGFVKAVLTRAVHFGGPHWEHSEFVGSITFLKPNNWESIIENDILVTKTGRLKK